jgi:hypothetical protein
MHCLCIKKFLCFFIVSVLSFSVLAEVSQKEKLAQEVTRALQQSDKEAFHLLINPLINNYNTSTLGLSNNQRAEFKQQLTTALTNYLAEVMLKTRIETFNETELRALVSHYNTPVGKKIATKLPLIRELQAIEPLDKASSQILTQEELAYAKHFAESDMGKAIAEKTKQVNQALLTKIKSNNALENQMALFSHEYLQQQKQHKTKR